jgi:hypothetical protein
MWNIPDPDDNKRRDKKRKFTQTQRNEILSQQNNLCAGSDCGHKQLDPRTTRFHHIEPWAASGKTISANGAALCANCHAIEHHNQELARQESESERIDDVEESNLYDDISSNSVEEDPECERRNWIMGRKSKVELSNEESDEDRERRDWIMGTGSKKG